MEMSATQKVGQEIKKVRYRMGKEAVYRRLRGEVSFTIDEVALLSQKLGISIDQIVGSHVSNKVTFDLNLLHASSALESYYEIINRYLQIFDYVKTDNTTEVYTASNSLPFTLSAVTDNVFFTLFTASFALSIKLLSDSLLFLLPAHYQEAILPLFLKNTRR